MPAGERLPALTAGSAGPRSGSSAPLWARVRPGAGIRSGPGGRGRVLSRRPEVGSRRGRSRRPGRPRGTLGARVRGVMRRTRYRRDRRAGGGRGGPGPRRRHFALVGQVNLAEAQAILQALHPHRRPPAVVAEQLHHRRHQEHPDHGRVQQQRRHQAERQALHHHQVGERERAGDYGEHQCGRGDQATRSLPYRSGWPLPSTCRGLVASTMRETRNTS